MKLRLFGSSEKSPTSPPKRIFPSVCMANEYPFSCTTGKSSNINPVPFIPNDKSNEPFVSYLAKLKLYVVGFGVISS
jgi:hypothetical protein